MNPALRFALCFVLAIGLVPVQAQVTRDFAVDLKADVAPTVPHITLSWSLRQSANITSQVVYRRAKGGVAWGPAIATLTTTDTSWADMTALPGVEYEYWMSRGYTSLSPNTAVGYITAGYHLPLVENRGKLLLVIDASMETVLAPEISQLKRDLTADGWLVQTISAARRDSLTDVTASADTKALIKAAYDADPVNVRQVYLLGHVPVPYAGNSAWDGHGNHSGAWSADGFYGDMDGTWTDSTVNNGTTANVRLTNIPGDGRLDQSTIPSTLELMVGRVDLVNMQRAPSSTVTEAALLRRYLRKAHDFKRKQGAYAAVERRVLIRDGFGVFGSESFMRTGWAWGFTGVGRPPEVTYDEAPSGNWWTHAATNTYLMANGNGGGSYETCGSVGATADFGRRPFRAAFVSLFGSYFGDWDVTNNFMRAPLAGNATGDGLGLTCFWAGRPSFFMHHMATGETVGYSMRTSMNSQFSAFSSPVYTPVNFGGGGTHCGLLGDPSLRMHVVEPPRHLAATSAAGTVNLSWAASSESGLLGYHVYRAATTDGPFTRLTSTPLAGTTYADAAGTPGGSHTYMVRTLKLETSPGGTYENLSLGEMVTLTVNASPAGAPANATGLAVLQNSSVSASLVWQDNSSDETGFRVERKSGPAGSWSTLALLGAGATTHTDAGPFTNNESYYYRVIAQNASGDSAASEEASFDAVPGFFEFGTTFARTSKTIGTAQIPVKRFGGVNGAVTVNYATSDTSALAGTHYTSSSGTLTWADGETGEKSISVPVINTASPQNPKQFRITLSSPSSGTGIGTYNAVSVLIEDASALLPSPWSSGFVGSITDSSPGVEAEGAFSSTTVGGSGLTTAATSENGQFIYQSRVGDGVLTAYVPAASPAQTGARYAVMVRESTAGGALMAATSTSTSTGEGSKMAYRATASATAVFTGGVPAQTAPRWVRITRAGNAFTSESSSDGINWNTHGTAAIAMSSTALWGLFHHSDDRSSTTYSGNFQVARFQNVAFSSITGPGAPGALSATHPSPGRVSLTWGAATLAAGYRIERRAENGLFDQLIDLPAGTLTFNDDHAAPDTAYEYRVIAFNSQGNSPFSNTIRVTTSPADVYVLLEGVAAISDATVKGGSAAENFGAETTLAVSGLSALGTTSTTAKTYLQFDVSGLPALKTASLRLTLTALRNLSMSGFNLAASLRMLPEVNDAWAENGITWTNAPLNNTAGNGIQAGAILVSSLSITPATIPSVGGVIGLDASATTINNNKGANNLVTYVLNSTTPAASIEFASREHPALPPPSLEVTYASPLPVRPSFLTVTEGAGSSLDLNWLDNSTGETGFEIERRPAGGEFTTLLITAAATTTHNDASTLNGTIYEYRVRSLNAAGASAWSVIAAGIAGGSTGPFTEGHEGYAAWMFFSGAQVEGDAAPAADADGDGLANLLEYALGTSANSAAVKSSVIAGETQESGGRFLTLTFQRRLDATDVVLAVEASDTPTGPWTSIDPLQPHHQAASHTGLPAPGWQTITVKDSVPVSEGAPRFMRLRVIQK